MAPPAPIREKDGGASSTKRCEWLQDLSYKSLNKPIEIARKAKNIEKDDAKMVIHSLEVGLALTLVSIFYYFKPLCDGFGVNAIWAALTVVVSFEFSFGATLGKYINRMLATLVAGALGVTAHHLASLSGQTGKPILIAIFFFILAAVTFARFFPALKARYDYGLTIFILTFSLVSVSGYRDDQILKMAQMRLTTFCIEFGREYFRVSKDEQSEKDKSFLQVNAIVLTSKSNEEDMANLARCEPGDGQFRFCHPWKQYLKIGNLTRNCATKIEALNCHLNTGSYGDPKQISRFMHEDRHGMW